LPGDPARGGGGAPAPGDGRRGGRDGEDGAVTNGGQGVTSGGGRRAFLMAWLAFAGVAGLYAAVNAVSVIADRASLGRAVPAWEPWSWEMTSFAAWLAVAPFVFAGADRLRPPRLGWAAVAAAHLLLSVLASLAHVGLMIALRMTIYAAAGGAYRQPGSAADILIYEYRKDLITYAILVAMFLLMRRLLAPSAASPAQGGDFRLEVRDGSRTAWLAPEDVEWAQSAGNYVELHGRFGTLLHRETLAALEEALAPRGFRRIHRSRIVRSAAVRAIETRPSGDFDVTLESGERLAGSRRFRARLQA
jgi:DNA-binding LytR/AlgR family response regulator